LFFLTKSYTQPRLSCSDLLCLPWSCLSL
jgi:hypothetical protein